jgi:RNA polymerase sigma-70 factor (ECF subfamily)
LKEQQLILSLCAGEQKAYQQFITSHQDRVFNTCMGYVFNAEDAEDLAQEVFLEVFRSIRKFKGESSLFTWVYRICVTKSLELIRRRKRKKRAGTMLSLGTLQESGFEPTGHRIDHPGIRLENKERGRVLYAAIDSLSENQRIAFTMHNLDGKSYQDIAGSMCLSLSSVESLIFRAKRNLRSKLNVFYRIENQ